MLPVSVSQTLSTFFRPSQIREFPLKTLRPWTHVHLMQTCCNLTSWLRKQTARGTSSSGSPSTHRSHSGLIRGSFASFQHYGAPTCLNASVGILAPNSWLPQIPMTCLGLSYNNADTLLNCLILARTASQWLGPSQVRNTLAHNALF